MSFRDMKVKEILDNPKYVELIDKYAPGALKKFPVGLFKNKYAGEVFDLAVSKGLIPKDKASEIEKQINEYIEKVG